MGRTANAVAMVVAMAVAAPAAAQAPPALPVSSSAPQQKAIEEINLDDLLRMRIEAATKTEITQVEAPQAVTILTRADIERRPALNLAELLRSVVGANVVRIQTSQNVLGMRGSNAFAPSKVLILIDGQPIDPTLFSTTWWELIPVSLDDVERIELIRSPGTIYGANAQNGVVNIITRKISLEEADDQRIEARASGGQQGFRHGYVGYQGKVRGFSYRLSGSTDTIDAYRNPDRLEIIPGRLSRAGEQTLAGQDNLLDLQSLSGAFEARLGGNTLSGNFGLRRIKNAQGRVPDRLCLVGLDGDVGYLNAKFAFHAGGARHTVSVGDSQIDFAFLRNDDSVTLTQAEMDLENLTLGYEAQRSFAAHNLLLGLQYDMESATNRSGQPFLAGQTVSREPTFTALAQDEWSIGERHRLYVGGLFSNHYVGGSRFAPFVAYVHRLDERNVVRVASFTSYRNPTVFEHSMDYDQTSGSSGKRTRLVSNRGLEPERTTSYEVGFRGQPGERLLVSVDVFVSEVSNGIEWRLVGAEAAPIARPRYRSENNLEQTVSGVEVDVKYRVDRHWSLQANLSATHIENRSSVAAYRGPFGRGVRNVGEGRYGASYVPPFIYNAAVEHSSRFLSGYLQYQYAAAHTWQWPSWSSSTGQESLDLKPVPGYGLLNGHLAVRFGNHLSIAVNGVNLLDNHHTEWRGDESYFGRAVWGGLTVRY